MIDEEAVRLDLAARMAAKLQAIVEKLTDAVLSVNADLIVDFANPAAERMFGADAELKGRHATDLLTTMGGKPIALDQLQLELLPRWIEGRGLRADGSTFAAEWIFSGLGPDAGVLIVRDVTRLKAELAALRTKALHDALTGLANRELFIDRLEQAIADSKRSKASRAVMVIDLNDFKEINDTHGHAAGDRVLKAVAHRLKSTLRATDTVARLGGDEFGILLSGNTSKEYAMSVAGKLAAALAEPVEVNGREASTSGSIGVALYASGDGSVASLLDRADAAMYVAKRNQSRITFGESAAKPETPPSA
ncbi:MAG TPA: sensor domain-containing diguanylate cyclase [Candidatus Dormibacteraeota bacterium]|nr:sensor domain-containing diguanylate cyclase [Candidatus Dormibacteraeota bacterium]